MDWYCGNINAEGIAAGTQSCSWAILPSELRTMTDPTLMYTSVSATFGYAGPTNGDIIAFGIIVWPFMIDDAVPTECPDPISECDRDWVYLWTLPLVAAAGTFIAGNANGPERDVQSKARRRLGNDKSLLVVVSSVGIGYNYHYHSRHLIKE